MNLLDDNFNNITCKCSQKQSLH